MNDSDRQLINWFKSELKSYLNNKSIIKRLEDQIAELDNRLEYHSPSLTADVHGSSRTHDEQLASYITARDKLTDQLKNIHASQSAVESVLEAIPEQDRLIIIRVHKGFRTIENEAMRAEYTKNELQTRIDRQILKAVKKIYGG